MTEICVISVVSVIVVVPTDAEITFADHAGRLYARRYGMAPMVGRLLGYLAICDPREQSIAELDPGRQPRRDLPRRAHHRAGPAQPAHDVADHPRARRRRRDDLPHHPVPRGG